MFYFLIAPVLMYNWFLIVAAIIPAVFLMIKVYKSDRLEKESPYMLGSMVKAGILSSLIALVVEFIGQFLLNALVPQTSPAYNVLLYFGLVAFAEEGAKFYMLKRSSWHNREFNCQYDGVVYAVFVSLGFALWENISYVMRYGFSTALVRAVTAIPGHACFGVFMGVFYGLARGYAFVGEKTKSKSMRIFCVVVPAFIHGAYDYIASMNNSNSNLFFLIFIAVMFCVSFVLVRRMSNNDHYFRMDRYHWDFEILN